MSAWPEVTLGAVCDIERRRNPTKRLPYVGLEHIEAHTGRFLGSTEPTAVQSETFSFDAGHVLYGRLRPYLNKVMLPEFGGHCSTEIFPLRPAAALDRRFLYYWLTSAQVVDAIDRTCTGARMPRANVDAVMQFRLRLPPPAEQRRIVTILDEAFEGIATATANAEKNLAKARELPGNLIEAILSTEPDQQLLNLADAVDPTCTLSYGIVQPGDHIDGGMPVVRPVDLKEEIVGLGSLKRIDPKIATAYQRTTLHGNEILLCVRGTTGTISLASRELEGGNVTRGIVPIRFNPDLVSRGFGYYLMRSAAVQQQIRAATYGTALMQINIGDLRKLAVRIPSLARQTVLSEKLDRLSGELARLQAAYSHKLALLAELKQSILHRAFDRELGSASSTIRSVDAANENYATSEFTAQLLAFAYERHVALNRANSFGHKKAQKILQSVEAVGGIDLGRQPIRDAAGPNDFQHMLRSEEWAKSHSFYEFVQRPTGGYDFCKLEHYDALIGDAQNYVEAAGSSVTSAIELLVEMNSDWAELIVTTHAAWNNLILDGAAISDAAIVQAARDDWHPDKLRFDKSRFHDALRFIRKQNITPDGSAKRVGGQEALPF